MKFFISLISLLLLINLKGPDPVDFVIPLALSATFIVSVLKGKVRKPSYTTGMFFFMFFIGYGSSILLNSYSLSYVLNLFINVSLFFLVLKSAKSEEAVRNLFLWLTIGATLTAAMALTSIVFNSTLLPSQFDVIRHDRYLGMYGDPNILGAFLVFLVFYWLSKLFNSRNTSVHGTLLSAFFVVTLLIQITATSSRSAAGGLFLGALLYLYIFVSSRSIKQSAKSGAKFFIPILFLIGASLMPVYDLVVARAETIISVADSEDDRFNLVFTAAAIAVSMENPFGVGPGQTNFATGIENADGGTIGAHNAFVQVFADNGWISGTTILLAIIMLWIIAFKNARRGKWVFGVDQTVMAASLTSFIFIGMFQDLLQWKVVWVFFAMLVAMHKAKPSTSESPQKKAHCDLLQ
jgi:hypothetical protein